MATVNLITRDVTTVEIDDGTPPNTNIDGIFTSGNASYSALRLPQAGFSTITGSIILTQSDSAINFDDRFNPLFSRGNKIIFTYEDQASGESYRYPVIGTTYIASTRYDFQSKLTINVSCILALLNKLTPQDLGICIEVGASTPVSTAVINLLEAAGIPSADIDTTSFTNLLAVPQIVEPFTVQQGQSIIETAGTWAGQHGVFFYQDLNGLVKAAKWSSLENKPGLFSKRARDLHAFQRSNAFDSRIKTLVLTYNNNVICPEPSQVDTESLTGNIRTEVEISRNEADREITRTTREYRIVGASLILIAKTIETSTYEAEPVDSAAQVRVGQAEANGTCFPEDKGRLLTRVTEQRVDNTEYIKAWVSTQLNAGSTGSGKSKPAGDSSDPTDFPVSGFNIAENVVETWNYISNNEVIYTREVCQARGIAITLWGDLAAQSGRDTDVPLGTVLPTDGEPDECVPIQLLRRHWKRSGDPCKGWKLTEELFELTYANDAIGLQQRVADTSTLLLQSIYDESFLLVPTRLNVQNNAGDPTPDTFPPATAIGKDENEVIFGQALDSSLFPFDVVTREFLGDFTDLNFSEIENIGNMIMDHNNGRIFGVTMADSPYAMYSGDPSDPYSCWVDFVPMFRAKIIEPYQNAATIYGADSPSITISATETVVGWLGVFFGQQTDPAIIADGSNFTYTQVSTQPPSGIAPQTVPIVALTGNYSQNQA